MVDDISLAVVIERKHPEAPAFVVVPAKALRRWRLSATTTVDASLDGVSLGRRSMKRWDDDRWFIELRTGQLEEVGRAPGDRARLRMSVASTELPEELRRLIARVPEAGARWRKCTAAQQRMIREDILGARSSEARDRRARKALLPVTRPRPPAVKGLGDEPRSVLVRIEASRLPGTSCGPYEDIRVGLPQRVGCDPAETVSGGARSAVWETRVEVLRKDGATAFRGPAVNGPPGERFLYLTWIGRKGGAPAAMFRRAKLRLDTVGADVLAAAIRSGSLVGRLDLTDGAGMPLCASVRPPAIVWSAGPPGRTRAAPGAR